MRSILLNSLVVSLAVIVAISFPTRGEADPALPSAAQAVLKAHCARCHGPAGTGKGGMNFILDRNRLVSRQKIIPGNVADSPLYQRVLQGEMPPPGVKARPSPDEVAVLRHWIEAGAPPFEATPDKRPWLAETDAVYLIGKDLQALAPFDRTFTRYLILTPLYNAGLAEADLTVARQAVAKLINSLSWHPRITPPRPVDAAQTVFRIDLRDYLWRDERTVFDAWESLLAVYPYRPTRNDKVATYWKGVAGTELPYLRGDWFVATASRPPLYQTILQLPLTDRDLERQLRVDGDLDLRQRRLVRAGFNGSGVARNNRLLERHDAAHGAYWHSYDFSDNVGRQNLFERPLGPQPGENRFQHAGGEIIFNLPNGLQAYLLVDANGRRIDRAPVDIVSDPNRPDKLVETGLSCMGCHAQGVMHKADQLRPHAEKNPAAFPKEDLDLIRALYVPEAGFKALIDEDAARFRGAVAKTGARPDGPEPILATVLRYEGEIGLATAAAEAGLPADDFAGRLSRSANLARTLGPLHVKGGTVPRQVFLTAYPDLLRELAPADSKLATSSYGPAGLASGTFRPFAGHSGPVVSLAFSPDGRRALSGSDDNTLRLWDVSTGREIRTLEGHTGAVLAVVFSPDGRSALSGSYDRTVRLWDLSSGRQLQRFDGHTERVSSVAFSPDGRRGLSGSWDQTLSLWDLATGRELRRFGGHASYISSVAFSPDGRSALSGGYDKTVRLWDLATGREVHRFEGQHTKEVYSVAFSPDGRRAVSGGNDQQVYLWDVGSGRVLRRLQGHTRAVVHVGFTADGRRVLSGSSQYQAAEKALRVWDAETGRELRSYGGRGETIWSLAFSADGLRALTGNADKPLRLWVFERAEGKGAP
jgi:mono/diheme cytochrome c family protein